MSSRSRSEPSDGTSCRVDKWLWAVRVFKTRTAATSACSAGRVTIDGEAVKPATRIALGDVVETRRGDRQIVYRVAGLVEKRVGPKLVERFAEDLSPPAPDRSTVGPAPPGGARSRGQGRPTKKERRQIDRLRRRD